MRGRGMKPTLQSHPHATPGSGAILAAPVMPATPRMPTGVLRMLPDDRLAMMVRSGSEPAFEALFDRHHRTVLAFCRHMVGSTEEAEDAVQHTFLAAYRQLRDSREPIHLRPWLYTVARNRCLSVLRARRERPMEEADEPSTDNLAAEVQRREDLRELLRDLSTLPDDQRAALVLAELGAASHEEIGEILGCPRTKVKALVFQARSTLVATRRARDTPCAEIREQLALPRSSSMRRTTVNRHVRECVGCREFRDQVRGQRRSLGAFLPVLPGLALRDSLWAAISGGTAAGGGAVSTGGASIAAKVLVGIAVAGTGTAAGMEAVQHLSLYTSPSPRD
jgi:RNA polymerase sigma factor (sigma-70 family)